VICSLTNKIADFEDTCPNFNVDESVKLEKTEAEPTPNYQVVTGLEANLKAQLRDQQDVVYALVGGFASALVSALLWAGVTVATNYQIGFMAIVVGLLVGISVRYFGAGIDQYFGFIGAFFALLGCAIGNLLSQIAFIADAESLSYFQTLSFLNLEVILSIYEESFSPIDLFFYGIAGYEGYKFAFRNLSETEVADLSAGKTVPVPYASLRLPVVISLFVALSVGWFFLSRSTQGEVTFYYESGAKRSAGQMAGGVENGPWKYWHENGNLFYEGYFTHGQLDSAWRYYNEEGILTSEGSFTKNMKHGIWNEYYPSGAVGNTSTYSWNRLHGPSIQYYEDGTINGRGSYHLDRMDGEWEVFYDNGNPSYKGVYDKEVQTGQWTWWTPEGLKVQEVVFGDGQRSILNSWNPEGVAEVRDGNGMYHFYGIDGLIEESGMVRDGKLVGIWKRYIDGELQEEGEYKDDGYYIKNAWSYGGKQLVTNGEGKYEDESGGSLFGSVKGQVKGGLKTGLWTVTSATGMVLQELNYKEGKEDGPLSTYFENGTVSAQGVMVANERQGLWKWYYENGLAESEASFEQGVKTGNQTFYTDEGVLLRTEVYENGELVDVVVP